MHDPLPGAARHHAACSLLQGVAPAGHANSPAPPEEARRAVLPSGLTSNLPLLQAVKHQAQLLARLRGKHGFTPSIQHLSFRDDLLESSQAGHEGQSRSVPRLCFQDVRWSPCDRLEDGSRWLALDSGRGCKRLPIVLDIETGQQICFEESPSPMRLVSDNSIDNNTYDSTSLHAAWLTDESSQILVFMSQGQISGSIACLADVNGHSLLPVGPPGQRFSGSCQFFTIYGDKGSALDVLFWFRRLQHCCEDQIIVFSASSRRVLYQLSCPYRVCPPSSYRTTNGQQGGALLRREVLLAPNQQLLAVIWEVSPRWGPDALGNHQDGFMHIHLSIHSASRGDLLHKMLLMAGTDVDASNCQPGWLPCTSNFMYISSGGLLHLVTASGNRLWSNAQADRSPTFFRALAGHDVFTNLNASPCGRWILAMEWSDEEAQGQPTGHVSVVEALTGKTLAGNKIRRSLLDLEARWSMSGEVCLLEQLGWVLICCQLACPQYTTFRLYALSGSTGFMDSKCQCLSPCVSTVVSLDNTRDNGQHCRILPTLDTIRESASAATTLQPVVCADFTAGRQSNGILQEAWHPLHSACICAIPCTKGGVHLIDAKANQVCPILD